MKSKPSPFDWLTAALIVWAVGGVVAYARFGVK